MKKLSRMTALMLALMLFITSLPITALAETTLDTSVWQGWVNSVKNAFQQEMETTETKEYTVPVTTTSNTIQRTENGPVTVGGAAVTASLPIAGTVKLVADASASSYQWQVKVGDNEWANIVGDTSATMTLTYAKIRNVMSGNAVVVRCVLNGDAETTTGEATVTLDETVTTVPETVTVDVPVTQEVRVVTGIKRTAADMGITTFGDDESTPPANYSIVINYVFEDGTQAANPWTGSIGAGMSYHQEVKSPEVVGYTPDQDSVDVNITSADTDLTYTVTYSPALVSFKVEHWQQNTDNDQYTLVSTDSKTGYTESEVGKGLENEYAGFYDLLYDTSMKIAADSSTVVKIYYDRYYYLMSFDLQGGYGTDPIYARYGASLGKVNEPTKAGYTFVGWSETKGGTTAVTLPTTMPAESKTYYAIWEPDGKVKYTVVYWKENADDDKYSYWGQQFFYEEADKTVSGSDSIVNDEKKYFTYNAEKTDKNVKVKGDGSTVVNVYYTRNSYKIYFLGYGTCVTTSHSGISHSGSCARTGSGRVVYVLEAKYEQNIAENWPTYAILQSASGAYKNNSDEVVNGTGGSATKFRGWNVDDVSNEAVSKRVTMTSDLCDTSDGIKTANAQYGASYAYRLYYMFEDFDQIDTTSSETRKQYTVDGKEIWFKSSQEFYQELYYSGNTTFAQKEITGMKAVGREKHEVYSNSGGGNQNKLEEIINWLYYTRNRWDLSYQNVDTIVKTVDSIMFEQPLKDYKDSIGNLLREFTPNYPSTLEPDAYVFEGWYTTPECYDGTQFNFETATMPNNDLTLYAHWVPVNHTVTFYLDKEAYDAGTKLDTHPAITVLHGALVDPTPEVPEKGAYEFIGWFYMDNGTEKAFDFDNMQVRKDLDVYAKWSSNVMVDYTIKYVLKDGTEIATATTGKNLAGTTKTFDAKVGDELNEGYQSGYFPTTNSHNLELNIEGENTYSFVYVKKDKVPYTVKYLEVGTEKVLQTEKHGETADAVITEPFVYIAGYAPDAYQKRLILSANEEENVIIFWYVADTEHAPVQIIHWTQNIAGDSYTEYSSNTILNGVIGTTYTETPKTIEGFKYRLSAEGNAYVSNPSGELTGEGLVLNLYYDRIEYPYEFKFLEQGTDKVLADTITGNARYQAQVTEKAKTIPGYKLVSNENQAITIAIEDPANVAKKNVKIFYYQEETIEIRYQVVGPEGCGTLSSYADSNVKVFTGPVNGSTPTANENFRFVGWFTDEDCTKAVDTAWVVDNKITPQKSKTIDEDEKTEKVYEAATYYAKFEYNLTTLTIKKEGSEVQANETFIFDVKKGNDVIATVTITGKDSVTIGNLTVGDTITVSERGSWSNRYASTTYANNGIKLKPDPDNSGVNTITVTNSSRNDQWLHDESAIVNFTQSGND